MLLDDIGDLLSTGGIGTVGINIFKSLLPDIPDTCVSIFETGGFVPLHTFSSSNSGGPVAEFPGIQIVCRAQQYEDARVLAKNVDVLLNGTRNKIVNGVTYQWIRAEQSPFFMDRDGNDRNEIVCNYAITRNAATS